MLPQVKKLVQKVVTRDSLHYRKLTDKPKEEAESEQEKEPDDKFITNLALGVLIDILLTKNFNKFKSP